MNAQDNDDYSRRSHWGKPVEGLTTARVWTMISKSKVKKKKKKLLFAGGCFRGQLGLTRVPGALGRLRGARGESGSGEDQRGTGECAELQALARSFLHPQIRSGQSVPDQFPSCGPEGMSLCCPFPPRARVSCNKEGQEPGPGRHPEGRRARPWLGGSLETAGKARRAALTLGQDTVTGNQDFKN